MAQDTFYRTAGRLGEYVYHLVQGVTDAARRQTLVADYTAQFGLTAADLDDLNRRLVELDARRATTPTPTRRKKKYGLTDAEDRRLIARVEDPTDYEDHP